MVVERFAVLVRRLDRTINRDGFLSCRATGFTALCLLFACLSFLSGIIYGIDFAGIVLFVLFQLGVLVIPGTALLALMRIRVSNSTAQFIIGYALGYALSILLYILVSLFGCTQAACIVVSICVFVASVIVLHNLSPFIDVSKEIDKYYPILCIVLFVITFFVFSESNYIPTDQANSYYPDTGYWMGNTIALTRGFPPIDFRNVLFDSYSYHYLPSMNIAFLSIGCNIPVFDLSFGLSYIEGVFLLAGASFLTFRFLCKSSCLAFLFSVLLLFSTGFEQITTVNYVSHLLVAPFGYDISLAYLLICIFATIRVFEDSQRHFGGCTVLGIASFTVCMGSKGPLGTLLLVFIFVYSCYDLAIARNLKRPIVYGLGILAVGIFIYLTLLSGNAQVSVINTETERSITTVESCAPMYDAFLSLPLPAPLSDALYSICFIFLCNPAMMILASLSLALLLSKQRCCVGTVASFASIIVALISFRLVKHSGFSQMYFLFGSYPFILLQFIRSTYLDQMELYRRLNSHSNMLCNRVFPASMRLLVVFLCGLGVPFVLLGNYGGWLNNNLAKGAQHLIGQDTEDDILMIPGYGDNYISPDIYEAMTWVRDNTEKDSRILDDAFLFTKSCPYYRSVIAEREFYIFELQVNPIDYNLVQLLYSGSDSTALTKFKKYKLDYIVQSNNEIDLCSVYGSSSLHRVFWNNAITIYKVR